MGLYLLPCFKSQTVFVKVISVMEFSAKQSRWQLGHPDEILQKLQFLMSLNHVVSPFKVHNIQVRFGRSTSSISLSTWNTLVPSNFIRSNYSFLVSGPSIIPFIQFLIKLELFVFPPSIWPVQSKISWKATGLLVPWAIAFINVLFLNVDPTPDPDRPNTSA